MHQRKRAFHLVRDRGHKAARAAGHSVSLLVLGFVAIPLLVDLGVYLAFQHWAKEFVPTQARILSIAPPAQPLSFRGAGRHSQLEVLVQHETNGRMQYLNLFVWGSQGSKFGATRRIDDVIPVWLSAYEVRLEPPSTVELFQFFPYLHLMVGIATTVAYLFLGALVDECKRRYKQF